MKKIVVLVLMITALFGCNNTQTSTTKEQANDSITEDTIPHNQRIGIKITKEDSVYTIPCLVNGVKMRSIIDTSACDVYISITEASFLCRNGYMADDDFCEETNRGVIKNKRSIYNLARKVYGSKGFNLTDLEFADDMKDVGNRKRLYKNLSRDAKEFNMSYGEYEAALRIEWEPCDNEIIDGTVGMIDRNGNSLKQQEEPSRKKNRAESIIADDYVTSGMLLKIKTIEIGSIILRDVNAIVSSSLKAPLLLGQSAIQKLGKVEMNGDSIFITGFVKHFQAKKSKESNISYIIPPSVPEISWCDKVFAFLGNEDKVEELCIQGWNAYNNDMPELAMKYCDKAIKLMKKSWKPYALKGKMKISFVKDNNYDVALPYFEKALELNGKRQTFYLNEVDSISHQYVLEQKCWCEVKKQCDLEKALGNAQEGLTLYPQSISLMNTISFAYTMAGNYEMGEKWANKLMKNKSWIWTF